MTQLETITNVLPFPIARVVHLRDDLFLVGYGVDIIELRDFSKPIKQSSEPDAPVASWNAHEQNEEDIGNIRDFDCKDCDESQIVIVFDSGKIGFLNLKDNSFRSKDLLEIDWIENQKSMCRAIGSIALRYANIKIIRSLPGWNFIVQCQMDMGGHDITGVQILDSNLSQRELISQMGILYGVNTLSALGGYCTELND